jgi:hypothetical protein
LTIEKYACTPLTTGAKSDDNGPVTSAMLPTLISVEVTPCAPPPELLMTGAFEHPATVATVAEVTTLLRRTVTIDALLRSN